MINSRYVIDFGEMEDNEGIIYNIQVDVPGLSKDDLEVSYFYRNGDGEKSITFNPFDSGILRRVMEDMTNLLARREYVIEIAVKDGAENPSNVPNLFIPVTEKTSNLEIKNAVVKNGILYLEAHAKYNKPDKVKVTIQ